jgi:hypothetical protein
MKKLLLLTLVAASLTSCNTTTHVLVGQKRAAIAPESVKIYIQPPKKFEQVAIVDTNSVNTFRLTQQGAMDATMSRLKHAAAALGANGILLNNVGNAPFATVTQGSAYGTANAVAYGNNAYANFSGNSMAMTSTLMIKTAGGMAIYVIEE